MSAAARTDKEAECCAWKRLVGRVIVKFQGSGTATDFLPPHSFAYSNLRRYTYFALKANAVQILTFVPLRSGLTLETLHQLQIPFAKLIGL